MSAEGYREVVRLAVEGRSLQQIAMITEQPYAVVTEHAKKAGYPQMNRIRAAWAELQEGERLSGGDQVPAGEPAEPASSGFAGLIEQARRLGLSVLADEAQGAFDRLRDAVRNQGRLSEALQQLEEAQRSVDALRANLPNPEVPTVKPRPSLGPKACEHCGNRYEARRADQKFCSTKCRGAAHRTKAAS